MAKVTQRKHPQQPLQDKPGGWDDLPATWRQRLASYGITDPAAWCRLGHRRHRLFGITGAMPTHFDALARSARS